MTLSEVMGFLSIFGGSFVLIAIVVALLRKGKK